MALKASNSLGKTSYRLPIHSPLPPIQSLNSFHTEHLKELYSTLKRASEKVIMYLFVSNQLFPQIGGGGALTGVWRPLWTSRLPRSCTPSHTSHTQTGLPWSQKEQWKRRRERVWFCGHHIISGCTNMLIKICVSVSAASQVLNSADHRACGFPLSKSTCSLGNNKFRCLHQMSCMSYQRWANSDPPKFCWTPTRLSQNSQWPGVVGIVGQTQVLDHRCPILGLHGTVARVLD